MIIWLVRSAAASGISDVLRQVDVPIESNAECNAVYGIVGDGVVCIDAAGGKGTCNVSPLLLILWSKSSYLLPSPKLNFNFMSTPLFCFCVGFCHTLLHHNYWDNNKGFILSRVTLAAPSTTTVWPTVSPPSGPPLGVRRATPMPSPASTTTWTGSSPTPASPHRRLQLLERKPLQHTSLDIDLTILIFFLINNENSRLSIQDLSFKYFENTFVHKAVVGSCC